MTRHVLARADEVAPGASKQLRVADRDIALFNIDGEFHAIADRCPHEGASLCKGTITGIAESDRPGHYRLIRKGEMVRCPWHGWEFDIRTGRSWCDPTRVRVKSYDVKVVPGREVEGPYRIEVFDVRQEDDYVVLEL